MSRARAFTPLLAAAAALLLLAAGRWRARRSIRKTPRWQSRLQPKEDEVEDIPPPVARDAGRVGTKVRTRRQCVRDPSVPGAANIFVQTFGCSHNTADAEYMMGLLTQYGYGLVNSLDDADCCVLNSCTVKTPSENAVVKLIKQAEKVGAAVVVSGCVPQADPRASGLEQASLLGTSQIDRVVEVVEEALKGHRVVLLEKKDLPSLDLPKVRMNKWVEIIAINTGCLGSCTYCKTKHARGVLGSYALEEVVARARAALSQGVREIWLTSEDTGAYGLDLGTNIVALLDAVVLTLEDFPGAMLRLGMTNPPYMLQHVKAMGRILRHPQVYEFLHVPVQSGSDNVLLKMYREYTAADFRKLVRGVREHCDCTIATDIICGFPGETEEDHEATMQLLREEQFPIVNITGFYARPNTPAARMKPVDPEVIKRRRAEAFKLFGSYRYRGAEEAVGKEFDVLFTETEDRHGQVVGHTKQYLKVVLPIGAVEVGARARIRITAAEKFHLVGELVGDSSSAF